MSVFLLSTLLNYAYPCRNWTCQRFAGAAQKKGRKGTNKNMTLAGSLTQVPGFSSADAITTKPRVPVAGPELHRYILNVSPFTLMKDTGVPENYVF